MQGILAPWHTGGGWAGMGRRENPEGPKGTGLGTVKKQGVCGWGGALAQGGRLLHITFLRARGEGQEKGE